MKIRGIGNITILDCDGKEIVSLPAMVQNPKTKRTYHIKKVKPNGRLVLYKHGWPRIRNADPRNWRLVPQLAEVRRD